MADSTAGEDPRAEGLYGRIAATARDDVGIGTALITLVRPWRGKEREYNRWYEDDHYFTALAAPFVFAGRRWTATVDLRALQYAATPRIAEEFSDGVYLGTYWISPGHLDDYLQWTASSVPRLDAAGRMYYDRDLVMTGYQEKVATVYRDGEVPPDTYSLLDPAPGIVLELIDAPNAASRQGLETWLTEHHLPSRLAPGCPVTSAIVFRHEEPQLGVKPELRPLQERIRNGGRRLTVLWFLTEDPRDCWAYFETEPAAAATAGVGESVLITPFVPSRMGTNTYE